MVLASLAILLTLAGYATLCAISPFGACRKCDAAGIRQARKGIKLCRRCHGQRYRLRAGRRLLNASRTVHRNGTR
ncbi:hypothetical protein [Streptomyces lavendulocolor]|uniref:hypothetical protein n=1 Tax=Streptomyces lavendulocolor TaxID=67316 RepID=UPI003C2C2A60